VQNEQAPASTTVTAVSPVPQLQGRNAGQGRLVVAAAVVTAGAEGVRAVVIWTVARVNLLVIVVTTVRGVGTAMQEQSGQPFSPRKFLTVAPGLQLQIRGRGGQMTVLLPLSPLSTPLSPSPDPSPEPSPLSLPSLLLLLASSAELQST